MTDFKLVIQYKDESNNRLIRKEQLLEILDSLPISYYAFILHDSDTSIDGGLKTPHYHLVIRFSDSVQKRQIIGWFSGFLLCNKNLIPVLPSSDLIHDVRYLCHLDSDSKYRYPLVEVLSSDAKVTNCILTNDLDNPCLQSYKEFNMSYIVNLVRTSKTLGDVFIALGLSNSKKYAYLINCLWRQYR